MDNNQCAQCRTEGKTVVITTNTKLHFDQLNRSQKVVKEDLKLGLRFNDEKVYQDTMDLLKLNCPYKQCNFTAENQWAQLIMHVRNEHHLTFCSYCKSHKKQFSHEFELYTKAALKEHEQKTTPDENGFKGHPICAYCKIRFYSQDELIPHLKRKHEECFICTRQQPDVPHFFQDYAALERHFGHKHYVCPEPSCLEKKFVVFESPVELEAHNNEDHAKGKPSGRTGGQSSQSNNENTSNQRNIIGSTSSSTAHATTASGNSSSSVGAQRSGSSVSQIPGAPPPSSSLAATASSLATASQTSSLSNTFDPSATAASNWTITPEMTAIADQRLRQHIKASLQNDNSKYSLFNKASDQFLSSNKNAYDLLNDYRSLFSHMNPEELERIIIGFTNVILHNPVKSKELNFAWEQYRIRMQLPNAQGPLANAPQWSTTSAKMHNTDVWENIKSGTQSNSKFHPVSGTVGAPESASSHPSTHGSYSSPQFSGFQNNSNNNNNRIPNAPASQNSKSSRNATNSPFNNNRNNTNSSSQLAPSSSSPASHTSSTFSFGSHSSANQPVGGKGKKFKKNPKQR